MTLWHLASRWWRNDRIRVSPNEGALWRIEPETILVIRGVPMEVIARRVLCLEPGPAIVYDCTSVRSRCQLRIESGSPGPRIVHIDADGECLLKPDSVEIFPHRGPIG